VGSVPVRASIVLPTFNRARTIGTALRSVLNQTEPSIEILVMDNASTDETPTIVAGFADPRVRYHRQSENLGVVGNWGDGLSRARGEFVAFLGDDDRVGPGFVASRLRQFGARPEITVVFSGYEEETLDGTQAGAMRPNWVDGRLLNPRELFLASLARQWPIFASLYRRHAVLAVWNGVREDDLVVDYSLHLQLALRGASGVFITARDCVLGVHPGQSSRAKRDHVFRQAEQLMQRLLESRLPVDFEAPLRRELSSWLVVHGRSLLANGNLRESRRRFRRAVASDSRHLAAWGQLVQSWIWPARLAAAARQTGSG